MEARAKDTGTKNLSGRFKESSQVKQPNGCKIFMHRFQITLKRGFQRLSPEKLFLVRRFISTCFLNISTQSNCKFYLFVTFPFSQHSPISALSTSHQKICRVFFLHHWKNPQKPCRTPMKLKPMKTGKACARPWLSPFSPFFNSSEYSGE